MKYFSYRVILLGLLTLITACKKFVDIDPPKDKLISATVFINDATANAALNNIYSTMFNQSANPYIMALYHGLSADELKSYSTLTAHQQYYQNALQPLTPEVRDFWGSAYNCIYQSNAVIEGCNASSTLTPVVKQQLIGEAYFIRAFWNFYLVNDFGDVPLVKTTDYETNSKLVRSDKSVIYEHIVSDLLSAQSMLAENYVGADGFTNSLERVRPNKSAATAFLARVYLFTGKFSDSIDQASKLIGNKATYDLPEPALAFLKGSKEAIWQISTPSSSTLNTVEAAYFQLTSVPRTNSTNSSTISTSLLNAFDTADKRKSAWIGKYTDVVSTPNRDYFFPNKYKNSGNGTSTEYSIVLRLAEQYLIRAESLANNGQLTAAIQDLDYVRNRAGLSLIKDVNPGISKADLIEAIIKEKRLELFAEWGNRWLDLKRTGKADAIMSAEAVSKGSAWNNTRQLFPIPQKEIDNDSHLTQNDGYR